MQSENFDNKIKESLSQRPPGNDTPEWDKMKMLLDKHMPVEKKDRRRFFFILFLFLLLGGGAFFIWQNNGDDDKNISQAKPATENSTQTDRPNSINKLPENNIAPSRSNTTDLPENTSTEVSSITSDEKRPFIISDNNLPANEIKSDAPEKIIKKNEAVTKNESTNTKTPNKKTSDALNISSEKEKTFTEKPSATIPAVTKNVEEKKKEPETVKPIDNTLEKPVENITEESKINEPGSKQQESQPTLTKETKTQNKKTKGSFLNNLFFTVSAGPDLTTVGVDKTGKIKPVFGAGIGYQVTKKFSIRTGFYSTRKIYTAAPEDYNPPYNFWTYYPNMKNIDADCKVYEIPVSVDYTISQNKKQSWFVSAGLSSYIMKKETYEYYFKPPYSPTYVTYTKTFDNENKHYFSVLNLSGGYTRNINKNISLRAEPYAKVALSGVGYGKVKLNSGGILFSAIIKPFARK